MPVATRRGANGSWHIHLGLKKYYKYTAQELSTDLSSSSAVRSYGTEGRVGDPAKEILGSDEIYEYIQFKGTDIKDLQVLDDQQHVCEVRA